MGIFFYMLLGIIARYTSSCFYRLFEAHSWKQNTVITAAAFPSLLVLIFVYLDIFLHLMDQQQQYLHRPSSRCFSYGYMYQPPLHALVHTLVSNANSCL